MPNKKRCLIFQIWEGRFFILGPSVCPTPPRGTLIFSCIRRLRLFLGVQKFWISIFFGVFRKLNVFGSMKILWIFFGVITKFDYTMHFRVFSEGQGTKWRIFLGLLKFQIYIWGAWNSWYFWGVNGRCWAWAYVWRKTESIPPPPQFKPIPVKCISVGFCPSGLLSQWALVLVGFCPVGFCPSRFLSYTPDEVSIKVK